MKIIFILLAVILFASCHETTVGYLETEEAYYAPDSLIIRKVPSPSLDGNRIKYKYPWVTNPIQSVYGTAQIIVTVKTIKADGEESDASKLWECLKVRGDGAMEVPFENEVPAGRYLVSLTFTNPGYSKDVNDCFTIIVQ